MPDITVTRSDVPAAPAPSTPIALNLAAEAEVIPAALIPGEETP